MHRWDGTRCKEEAIVARPAKKARNLSCGLEEFLDDDLVLRNGEALQQLVKGDLELLSQDCLDATECLLRLATYYRAEILKLHSCLPEAAVAHPLDSSPIPIRPSRMDRSAAGGSPQ